MNEGSVQDLGGFISLILPEGVTDYFDFVKCDYDKDLMTIHLDEKMNVPAEFKKSLIKASGFTEPRIIKDFPIRGKKVNLSVRKRRWEIRNSEGNKQKVSRDWDIIEQGTNITIEFAAFLKAIS